MVQQYFTEQIQFPNEIEMNGKHYCPFCGQIMEEHSGWDEYEPYKWYTCKCKDFEQREYVREAFHQLKKSMPKIKYNIKTSQFIAPV